MGEELLLIFDLDGTLFKTESTVIPAVQSSLKEAGLEEAEREKILSLLGERTPVFCEKLVPEGGEKLESFRENLWHYERKYIGESGELYDGIVEMITGLEEKGFPLAVLSNGSDDYVNYVLECCDIRDRFDHVVSSSQMDSKAQAIREMMEEHGGDDGKNAVMVGDKKHDFLAAEEAGIPSIGVDYGYGEKDEMEMADFRVEDVEELRSLLNWMKVFFRIEKDVRDMKGPIIGIDGPDNSGKTVMSEDLKKYFEGLGHNTQIIHLDDFHNRKDVRREGEDEMESYLENAFDLDRLVDELLGPIKSLGDGEVFEKKLDVLDLQMDSFDPSKGYEVTGETVVVLEGTTKLRSPVIQYLDHTVYLHTDFEEVLGRAKNRDEGRFHEDVEERYRRKYIPVQKKYRELYSPEEGADMVVDTDDLTEPIILRKG